MQWQWEVLAAVVRFLFLLAPFLNVAKDFPFRGNDLAEAKEFVTTANCRAMLVSFPAELLIIILSEASKKPCRSVNFIMIAVYVIAAFILGYGLFRIPVGQFRGTIRPFVWLGVFTALSVIAKTIGLMPALNVICRP